jgi:hypothetical protein
VRASHKLLEARLSLARLASYLCGLADTYYISTFLAICGILDFDIDVTGPHCIVEWTWISNFYLQLSLPLVVRDSFGPAAACTAAIPSRASGVDCRRYVVLGAFGTSGCFREPDRVLNIRSDGMHCSPLTADQ